MMFFIPGQPEEMPENAVILWKQFDEAWENLAKSVTDPDMLFELLEDIVNNPLCIAVSGALLVVLGFKVFAHIIISERG